jgi:Cd2+/Zn2+-exporting ATPase
MDRKALGRAVRIGVSALLLLVGILFHDSLHGTPHRVGEYSVLISAYLLVGAPVLLRAASNIIRGRVFDEMFLMTVATAGAIAIHQLPEAVAVMLLYSVGEHLQDSAVGRSRRSISALMDLRPHNARIVEDTGISNVPLEQVRPSQVVEVLAGERVGLDGVVIEGNSAVDTSALTGESVPREVFPGDEVSAGFVNHEGRLRIRVTRPFAESSVSRILKLVQEAADRKAPTERFLSRFASVYTPVVVVTALAVAFLPPLILPGATLSEWVYRALVMLVISCPCALVVSVPLGYFGGIGGASRSGILVKGATVLDALRNVVAVVLDKTGTITKGTFTVTRVVPRNGHTEDEVLRYAALAEAHSNHPIAVSIRAAYRGDVDTAQVTDVREDRGYGVVARAAGVEVCAGSDRMLHREGIAHTDCDVHGTAVYVAVDRVFAGYLVIADQVKTEAPYAVRALRATGVRRIALLTGDNRQIAADVAAQTGIDEYYAELLPEEKIAKVDEIRQTLSGNDRAAFVGDGINDAPVLMHADVGIAMGDLGSDAAIEAADVVIMDDNVARLPAAIEIGRHTRKVVLQGITLALGIKVVFLLMGALGVATMWEAVIADVGVSVLAVLNATRTLRYSATSPGRHASI